MYYPLLVSFDKKATITAKVTANNGEGSVTLLMIGIGKRCVPVLRPAGFRYKTKYRCVDDPHEMTQGYGECDNRIKQEDINS